MSDPKVRAIAKDFLNYGIKKMVDTALAAMEVDIKKDSKAYFKASRQIFKALVAAAAQRMLEDGANRQLLRDTYSPEDAWGLFLELHPDIAAKVTAAEPKAPPKPQKKLNLKLIEGGKPLEEQSAAKLAASLDEDEEALLKECDCSCHDLAVPAGCGNCECVEETLVKDDGSCGCACHFEHDEWAATGHDCCINETKGDEVL